MRLRIAMYTYATACMWPHERYTNRSKTWIKNHRYFTEVKNYLAVHPDATTFDVALECHFSDKAAGYWINRVKSWSE